jgi:hypothetical protein
MTGRRPFDVKPRGADAVRRGPGPRAGWRTAGAVAVLSATLLAACSFFEHGEGLDAHSLPADQQSDYAVFAQRCSKCHSLARPLNSGITKDEYWRMYVERMRRQPASGISEADTVPILRFLHWYSSDEKHGSEQ